MGILDSLFGKRLFQPHPDDVKMWQSADRYPICEPCNCLEPHYKDGRFGEMLFHSEKQNTDCDAWQLLESLVEDAAGKRSKEFAPGLEMRPEMWNQIITLPRSIAKLTCVRRMYLYGSNLIRIPPAIGGMESLEELDVYTSYRLHWLPFEITRCRKLKRSRASTRALYGNYKFRPPFPRLGNVVSKAAAESVTCSVCDRNLAPETLQVWVSLLVATDVFPLLVNACSEECIGRIPKSPTGYVDRPHTGGLALQQPQPGIMVRGVVIPTQEG